MDTIFCASCGIETTMDFEGECAGCFTGDGNGDLETPQGERNKLLEQFDRDLATALGQEVAV